MPQIVAVAHAHALSLDVAARTVLSLALVLI